MHPVVLLLSLTICTLLFYLLFNICLVPFTIYWILIASVREKT